MSVLFVSLRNTRVHLQNKTFILRNGLENHSDMAYQKYCEIIVWKEVCLHYCLPVDTAPLKLGSDIRVKSLFYIVYKIYSPKYIGDNDAKV